MVDIFSKSQSLVEKIKFVVNKRYEIFNNIN